MHDLSDITLKPSDFPSLAAMCRLDLQFPATLDEWLSLVDAADKQARQRGLRRPPILLDPQAFQAWCQKVAVIPCIDALRAYAIVRRTQA